MSHAYPSIKDFGAAGNGVADDWPAFSLAFQSTYVLYLPPGNYLIGQPIVLPYGTKIIGSGASSIITTMSNNFDAIEVNNSYCVIENLIIQGGNAGIRFIGTNAPCVQNAVQDVQITNANYGMVLDGGTSFNYPCYWNNFNRVLILSPNITGILLTKSGSGDTPNANTFHSCRVYSNTIPMTGDGIYVQYGNYRNSFIDCESNIYSGANSCIHLGANANDVRFINPYTETSGSVTNILIDSGSGSTSKHLIIAQSAESAGAAIADNSGGNYVSFNAPATTNSQQNFFQSLNIGWPVNVLANTLQAPFQIHGLNSNTSNMGMFIYLNNSVGTRLSLNKSRSTTLGNQGAVVNGDDIGYLDYNASDNSHFLASAQIKASVDQAVTAGQGYVAGRISFLTSPQNNGGLLEAMRIDSNQNVVQGTAALATNATNGFMYIATCAGAPAGTPASYTGRVAMVYDTTNHKFWIYDTSNSSWKGIGLS